MGAAVRPHSGHLCALGGSWLQGLDSHLGHCSPPSSAHNRQGHKRGDSWQGLVPGPPFTSRAAVRTAMVQCQPTKKEDRTLPVALGHRPGTGFEAWLCHELTSARGGNRLLWPPRPHLGEETDATVH